MLCPAEFDDASTAGKRVCDALFPGKFIMNRISMYLRQLLEFYYAGKLDSSKFSANPPATGNFICTEPSCRTRTR